MSIHPTKLRQPQSVMPIGVNLIFLLVTLAAYGPTLFSPALRILPPSRIILYIALGLAYFLLGTRGWDFLVENLAGYLGNIIYFALQLAIVYAIGWMALDLPNSTWIMMMPLAGQSLVFPWWGVALFNSGLLGSFAVLWWSDGSSLSGLAEALLSLGTGILFVLIFTYIALREEEARNEIGRLATELQGANDKLRAYAAQVEELATTKERNRLAREIHDSLGHYLTVINVQLEAAQAVLAADPARAADALQKSQRMAQDGLAEVRRSVATLRESPIDNRPLPEAITDLVNESRAAGIITEFTCLGSDRLLSPQVKLTLYRAVQEGLTNARKHAHASRIDVTLDYRDEEDVCLTIRDNGVGSELTTGGFGLLGLRERVQLLEGSVDVETAVGAGFSLRLSVPA